MNEYIPNVDRILTEFGPILTEFGPILTKFGQILVVIHNFSQKLNLTAFHMDRFGFLSQKTNFTIAKVGKIWYLLA